VGIHPFGVKRKKRRDEAAESCTIDGESPVVKNLKNLENPE